MINSGNGRPNSNSNLSEKDYSMLSFIFKSKIRRTIVMALLNGNLFPSQIRDITKFSFPSVSKNLKQLERKKIVKCKNPDEKKGKIYFLTDEVLRLKNGIVKWNNRLLE